MNYFYEGVEPFDFNQSKVKHWIEKCVINEAKMMGDISIIFCSDNYLLEVNKQYLKHDYFTDIITFDYTEGNIVAGDLFLSIDRIKENATALNTGFDQEFLRVVIHGILHLLEYNDKTTREKEVMTEKENFYLSKYGEVGKI